jgi:hypothetical protein
MKDNKYLFRILALVVGCIALVGLYLFVKSQQPPVTKNAPASVAVPSVSQPEAAPDGSIAAIGDGTDIELRDGAAAGITMASTPGGECSLDYLGQGSAEVTNGTLKLGETTSIVGWAAVNGKPAKRILLEFKPLAADGAAGGFVELNAGLQRDDVAAAKGSEGYRHSGYSRIGGLKGAASGSYRLYLALDYGDSLVQCDLGKEVAIQ